MMELRNEQKTQAEYDRFIDFMVQMYLKYGTQYRAPTAKDVYKYRPEFKTGQEKDIQKGA